MQTLALLNSGNSIEETARKHDLKVSTIGSHIAYLIRNGYNINISAYVSDELLERVRQSMEKLGEKATIKEILEDLNNEVPGHLFDIASAWIKKQKQAVCQD
jgi:uncharacterized protein YpbB